jgi:hypothetical protein
MMEINDHPAPNMADSEAPSKPNAVTTIASVEIDPKAERALVWKFDLRLLPVLAIMYLFNSLDKSNLGNAKTAGLEGKPIITPSIMIASHTSLPKIPSISKETSTI